MKLGLRKKEQGVPVEADDDGRPKAEGNRHGEISVELPVKMPCSFSLCEFSTESKQEQEERCKTPKRQWTFGPNSGLHLVAQQAIPSTQCFFLAFIAFRCGNSDPMAGPTWVGMGQCEYLISLILAVFFNPFCTLGNGVRKISSASAGNWTASDNGYVILYYIISYYIILYYIILY